MSVIRRPNQRPRHGRPVVLHVTTSDVSLDLLLLPQLIAFARAGYRVLGASAPGPHTAILEAAGIEHHPIHSFTRASKPLKDLQAVGEVARLIRKLRPDIVHTHNPKPGVLARPIARLLGVPLVVNTQHGLYAQPDDHRSRRLPVYIAERVAAAFSHVELIQNPEDVHTLVDRLRLPADRFRFLGNGIDLNRFNPTRVEPSARLDLRAEWGISDDEVLVGAVCRLTREKGIAELLAAFKQVQALHSNVRFVVIGPDEASEHLQTLITAARSAGVIFTGLRTDMPVCYSAMDLFVTATWREGFPRAAMEASAMGLPLIATDVRGCRQVVTHNKTGLLVEARSADSLAEAIDRLVSDGKLRKQLGSEARTKANTDFDDRVVIQRTLDTYSMLGG